MNRLYLVGAMALMIGLAACGESDPKGGGDPTCNPTDTLCGLSCVDTDADSRNCGACGTVCDAGEVCADGACAIGCPVGQAVCDGACFDLGSSTANCGSCGTTCSAGEACAGGACVTECPAGQNACDGGCFELDRSRDHCGACGIECGAGEICSAGACETSCPAGQDACDGACYDLESSGAHCGECGTSCSDGQVCTDGACATSCAAGLTECGGTCVDLDADRANCGACNTSCGSDELCTEGACTLACAPGTTDCDGTCRATQIDRGNCGGCGILCGAEEICTEGACVPSCGPYASDVCDDGCTNFATDPLSCGSCGNACAEGDVCSEGVCADSCEPTADVCADGCTSFQHDPGNCGECGATCLPATNATAVCGEGACGNVCLAGYADCNGDLSASGADGCETVLATDVAHCGACGIACPNLPNATTACFSGECVVSGCADGWSDCDHDPSNGCEVDTRNDPANCSSCGATCDAGDECRAGQCGSPGIGDVCDTAPSLRAGLNSIVTDAHGREYMVDNVSCSSTAPNGPDVVLQYTASFDGGVTLQLDKPDKRRWHLVVNDSPCGTVTDEMRCVSTSDPSLETSFGVVTGKTYFIYLVGAAATAHIPAALEVTLTEHPDSTAGIGESCSTAFTLANGSNHVPWVASVNNYVPLDISCATSTTRPAGPDVVFSYTATHDGGVEILFDNPSARRWFAVVSGNSCGTIGEEVACTATGFNATATRSAFNVTTGQTYFIYLTGSTLGTGLLDLPVDVRVNPIDCSVLAPEATRLMPEDGGTTTSLYPTFEVAFSHEIDTSAGTIQLTGDRGTEKTIAIPSSAVRFATDSKSMTINPDQLVKSGEVLQLTWSGINDLSCGRPVPAAPWTVRAVDAGCDPGQGGMVGTEITRVPMNALGSVSRHYVVADEDPAGYVYLGGTSMLVRMPKAGGAFEDIARAAKLGTAELGYTMLVDGLNIYTVDERASGVDKRLWRISSDGGATWEKTDMAEFGDSAATDPEDDFRGVAAKDGRIFLITQEGTLSMNTQIWSVDPRGTLPTIAMLEHAFGAAEYTNCHGLAMDSAAFFTTCRRGSETASPYAVLRISRTDGVVTQLTTVLPGNIVAMALHAKDHDGDGFADFLYFQGSGEEAYFVCAPHAAQPHAERLYNFGTGVGRYGFGFDSTDNALWQFDDRSFEFVKIK